MTELRPGQEHGEGRSEDLLEPDDHEHDHARLDHPHDHPRHHRHRLLHEVPRLEMAFIHVNPCGHDGTDVHALTRHHGPVQPSERPATIVHIDDRATA